MSASMYHPYGTFIFSHGLIRLTSKASSSDSGLRHSNVGGTTAVLITWYASTHPISTTTSNAHGSYNGFTACSVYRFFICSTRNHNLKQHWVTFREQMSNNEWHFVKLSELESNWVNMSSCLLNLTQFDLISLNFTQMFKLSFNFTRNNDFE